MQLTRVLLITGPHQLEVGIATEGRRVLDILNDRGSEYLKLESIRRADAGAEAAAWDRGVIQKSSITLVAPVATEHEAPEKRHNYMVHKQPLELYLTLPEYEVRGYAHLGRVISAFDYQVTLNRDGMTFFAVTDATLTRPQASGEPLRLATALVNRQRVGFFHLREAAQKL